MSNPADKIERSEYAPKPGRYVNQPSNSSTNGELPRVVARSTSDRDLANLVQSLEPAISRFRPWRPGWFVIIVGLVVAIEVGGAIGMYFADGTTWRRIIGFNTNTNDLTSSKQDISKTLKEASSPVVRPGDRLSHRKDADRDVDRYGARS